MSLESPSEKQSKEARAAASIATFVRLRGLASTFSYTADASAPLPAQTAVKIKYGDESRLQFLHLRLPRAYSPSEGAAGLPPVPVVVAIHGGFWKRQYGLGYFELLALELCNDLNVATVNIEYRRVASETPSEGTEEFCEDEQNDTPDDKGGWPITARDICKALGFIVSDLCPKYGLDASRIVLVGHSAGGHLAALIPGLAWRAYSSSLDEAGRSSSELKSWFGVSEVGIKGTVVLAGVMDLSLSRGVGGLAIPGLMGDSNSDSVAYKTASPSTYAPGLLARTRMTLIQGTDDDDVPVWCAREFMGLVKPAADKLGLGDRLKVVYLQSVGHFPIVDPHEGGEAWEAAREAVRELL